MLPETLHQVFNGCRSVLAHVMFDILLHDDSTKHNTASIQSTLGKSYKHLRENGRDTTHLGHQIGHVRHQVDEKRIQYRHRFSESKR